MDRLNKYCREAWVGLGLRPDVALSDPDCIVVILIVGMLCLCFTILLIAVSRRVRNGARYKALDHLREYYSDKIRSAILSKASPSVSKELMVPCESLPWLAIEDTLFELLEDTSLRKGVCDLFIELGYVHYYESKLSSRKTTRKALAIDKLGRLRYEPAATKLLDSLSPSANASADIIAVTVRALCSIGERDSIDKMFGAMPDIFNRHVISEKTLTTALLSRDSTVTELLLGYHGPASLDSRLLSAFLEVLKVFPVDRKSYDFAIAHLGHNEPEVRVKALKLLASTQHGLVLYENTPILSLLKDPVWFVRLHAVKVLGLRRCWPAAYDMVRLTSDENWQVRSAAAAALAGLGGRALVLILDILKSSDQYAKEAVCRAVSTEVFVNLLRAKIEVGNPATVEMVREIIALMSSLNFELPLKGMTKSNDMHIKPDGGIKSLSEEA